MTRTSTRSPREETDIAIVRTQETAIAGAGWARLGSVEVTHFTVGYQRKKISTNEMIELVPLELPRQTLTTRACWYTVPRVALERARLGAARVLGAVHAAEHTLIGLLPLFAICDRWDVGGVSMAIHPQTGEPTIFVYDGYPGGAGIAELAFGTLDRHLSATRELVEGCGCDDGCPSCVQSPKCGNWNEHLDKDASLVVLRALTNTGEVALARPA